MQHKQLQFGHGVQIVLGDDHSQAAQMTLASNETEGGPENRHYCADQWHYVVSGKGVALIGGQRIELREDTLVLIRRGDTHEIRNTSESALRTLNVYVPPAYSTEGNKLAAARG
jgi:mannose-6-phosphate isomerase-like protein (cupin superfamily)